MRKPLAACLLQLYALALAATAAMGGVRTDEAKYLLNIPYPHPPLARFLLESTADLPWNEALWRVLFATLIIQSVWLVMRLPQRAGNGSRALLGACWLLSGSVVLQAPTIMMAPLTAFGGLVLVWASCRQRSPSACFLVALGWFASVFVAYQSALFLPLVIGVLLRSGTSNRRTLLYAFGPLAALTLYTFTNPLALHSLIGVGSEHLPWLQKLTQFALLWLMAGSIVVSLAGTIGIFVSRRCDWIAAFVLICAYITLSYHAYYAIFLVPLFLAGIATLLDHSVAVAARMDARERSIHILTAAGCVCAIAVSFGLADRSNAARDTMRVLVPQIRALDKTDARMLIVGDFGHEWQYYTPPLVRELLKYEPEMTSSAADVVVCWHACPSALLQGKDRLPEAPVETWIHRDTRLQI